jgi:hypothetical protein
MPRMIELDHQPLGYCVEPGFTGETVTIRSKEFLSSEDGNDFTTRLEGVTNAYAPVFGPGGVKPSQVDHFLAVVHPDRRTTVYCNELQFVALARIKRVKPAEFKTGELLFVDDIADIEEVELRDSDDNPISVPDDCGVCLIFSHGWRKGLFFDYSVFGPHGKPRTDKLPKLFGHFLARLVFQEMYSVTDDQWRRLFEWGWFPFAGLKHDDRKKLLSWANFDRYPGPVLEEISRNFGADLEHRLESWKRYELLNRQMEFLSHALSRYQADDHVSCISILYPRIEGVMRTLFTDENPGQRLTQGTMVTNLVENQYVHSVLLPNRFDEYLKQVYFREFKQSEGEVPLSRHSIAHGVSKAKDYDLIRASLGFMVLDQIFHYLSD